MSDKAGAYEAISMAVACVGGVLFGVGISFDSHPFLVSGGCLMVISLYWFVRAEWA